jgi:hypothetical protein
MKRKRSVQYIHMPTTLFKGEDCASCGTDLNSEYRLNPDEKEGDFEYGKMVKPSAWTLIKYYPKTKSVSAPQHYYCSWGTLMSDITELGRRLGY